MPKEVHLKYAADTMIVPIEELTGEGSGDPAWTHEVYNYFEDIVKA